MEKLEQRIKKEQERCIGEDGGRLSSDRERLKLMYLGSGYEADEERAKLGLSTYVDRAVLEAVEWAKPGLMRVFAGGEIIRFEPKTPEQEQAAEDATLYVNQAVFGRNMFRLVHDCLADGLYQRAGWALAKAEKAAEDELRQFSGLTEEEATAVLAACPDPDAAVISMRTDPQLGTVYDLSLKVRTERTEIAIESVPPEHVIVSSDAESVEKARFIAMWDIRTRSDLLKDGYPAEVLDGLPRFGGDEMPETIAGRSVNDEDADGGHEGRVEYQIYEAWLDYDLDGDGIAEKVHAVYAGGDGHCKVIKAEQWPLWRAPLFAACSVPMPHQVVGLCLADLVADLQTLKTELSRQYLDSLAFGNTGELIVKETAMSRVDYDSLLSRAPGRLHRVSSDVEIVPMPTAPVASEARQGVTMADGVAERRTGISARTQSLNADALQNTATGASIMEEAVNQRLELIARVYAEDFFRPLGRYVLHLIHKYHDKDIQMRVKGRFLKLDPRNWDPDMNITVTVGLGSSNRTRLASSLNSVLNLQVQFLRELGPASPVRLPHIVYTCHKLAEANGLEAPERFFGTEEDARRSEEMMARQGGEQKPDKDEQKMQLEQEKAQAKIQLDQQKAQTEAQRKAYETQSKLALEKQKQEGQLALKRQEMASEAMLDRTKLLMGERGSGLTNVRSV